jgi:ParB-like chromosome segregation protein Spo0J
MPIASESSRVEQIESALAAAMKAEGALKIAVPFKGKRIPLTVARVPVGAVVHNPNSHRIRAELESHPNRDEIEAEPFSEESQEAIASLLRATEGFEDLRASIQEQGQEEPGVVTRKGVLVDANTRLAALRSLDQDYIDVAVLPEDADPAAIDRIESDLQFRKDFKQEYSFTNNLLLLDDQLNKWGYSEEKVARDLNWAASSDEAALKKGVSEVRQQVRLLARIREIQAFSDNRIPLTFFDEKKKKQILIELDDEYEKLRNSDPTGAERLKDARIAGILVGTGYRELRYIDPDSIGEALIPQLEERDEIGPILVEFISNGGSETTESKPNDEGAGDDRDLLEGDDPEEGDDVPALRDLAKALAVSYGKDQISLGDGNSLDREAVINELALAIDDAAEETKDSRDEAKGLAAPVKQLQAAVKKSRSALAGYKQLRGQPGFKKGTFAYHANKLKSELSKIEAVLNDEEK